MRRTLLLAAALALAACSADVRPPAAGAPSTARADSAGPPAAATADSAAPSYDPPVGVTPADSVGDGPEPVPDPSIARAAAFLVWTGDSIDLLNDPRHAETTVWLDAASGRVLERRRGMYAASGARLWAWREGAVRTRGLDCQCTWDNERKNSSGGACYTTVPVRTAALTRVDGGRGVEVIGRPDPRQMDGETPPDQSAAPEAGAGPYLFVVSHTRGSGCGAHGWAWSDHTVLHLPRGAWMKTDTGALSSADSATALPVLQRTEPMEDETVNGFSLNQEARWGDDGMLQTHDRFLTSTAFAFSDEESYTRSEVLPRRRPRPWIAPWVRTPAPVVRYWIAAGRPPRFGWALVDSAHARGLRAQFRSR